MNCKPGDLAAFAASNGANSQPISELCRIPNSAACPELATPDEGHGLRLSDEQRESAIQRAGERLEHHMTRREVALQEYDITGDFGAKAEADRHRTLAQEAMRLQTELIRGRSPEVVARLEMERGLA